MDQTENQCPRCKKLGRADKRCRICELTKIHGAFEDDWGIEAGDENIDRAKIWEMFSNGYTVASISAITGAQPESINWVITCSKRDGLERAKGSMKNRKKGKRKNGTVSL